MRTWTREGRLVTRRVYERHLGLVFGTPSGGRVMTHARGVGLVSTGKQGEWADRPLTGRERAVLILITALIAGTNLTLLEAARLVSKRQDWIRQALASAATGADLKLRHAFAGDALAVEVTIGAAALRDPVIGLDAGHGIGMAA